jgi:TolA-binding protein
MKPVICALVLATLVLGGCGKPPAEEYLKKAEEAEKAGLWSVALENYQSLVKDHPGSVLAENASFSIAAIQHNSMHDFQAAIEGYRKFVEQYPEAKKAPTAMFLMGFLYHNEMKNLDSARACYERFLVKFPGHEMAMSAQFELQNLGKSPDEILNQSTLVETSKPKPESKTPSKPGKN